MGPYVKLGFAVQQASLTEAWKTHTQSRSCAFALLGPACHRDANLDLGDLEVVQEFSVPWVATLSLQQLLQTTLSLGNPESVCVGGARLTKLSPQLEQEHFKNLFIIGG